MELWERAIVVFQCGEVNERFFISGMSVHLEPNLLEQHLRMYMLLRGEPLSARVRSLILRIGDERTSGFYSKRKMLLEQSSVHVSELRSRDKLVRMGEKKCKLLLEMPSALFV